MEAEELVSQYDKYCEILGKVSSPASVEKLNTTFGERLALAPRGLTEEDGGAAGELVGFSLRVASVAKTLSSSFGHTKSLVKVALLHELGKLGGPSSEEDLFISQDSDWHRDKLGQMYKYNENCPKMNTAHRTLWILSHLGFDLTREEWVAINVSQGMHLPENQFYGRSLNPIAAGLLSARLFVLHGE